MNDNNENNENNNNDLNSFIANYGGATLGGIIALILCFTQIYRLLVGVVIIFAGMFLWIYVQKNKSNVKEKLKEFIDKF